MDNKWIPVTEELPPSDKKVLAYCSTVSWSSKKEDPDILVGFYSPGRRSARPTRDWFCETYDNSLERIDVTHWMPLPEAPNGEE